MIEISHKQARHLLRIEMDRHLPNEQWTSLQAHLENCPECRQYRDHLAVLEKDLRRTFHSGWETVTGPSPETPKKVLTIFQQRAHLRQRLFSSGLVLAGFVLVFFLGRSILSGDLQKMIPSTSGAAVVTPDGSGALDQSAEPAATPIPTAKAGDFPDVILFEGRLNGQADGKKQIYLLNPGSDPVDLFNGTSNDSDPVWSPDGEWIAFLSDRTGKEEVFVTSIAGNKVVQLTNNPGVSWEGPLSWSADGKWLALAGVRNQEGNQRWVYAVALDGTGARALVGSRGGNAPKFAPFGDRLAFTFSDGSKSGVIIYHLETGEKITTDWPENAAAMAPAPGSSLDWSANGTGLVYIAADTPNSNNQGNGATPQSSNGSGSDPSGAESGTPGSQILVVRDLSSSITLSFDFTNHLQVAQSAWPGAYRAVSWTPGGTVLYLEDLGDARANDKPGTTPGGCWTIQALPLGMRDFFNSNNNNNPNGVLSGRMWSVNGLCVEGGLDHQSWTPDGRWVVVLGRLPSSQQRSLYAIRMPGRGFGYYYERPGQGTTTSPSNSRQATPQATFQARPYDPLASQPTVGSSLRLVEANWTGALPRVRPRLSSYSQPVNIDPQPVAKLLPSLPPSDLSQRSDGPTGQIVYTVQNNSVNAVVKANPDGTGGQILAMTTGLNRCPRFSADGQLIALVAPSGNYADSSGMSFPPANPAIFPQQDALPGDEIYVMDANGNNVIQISSLIAFPDSGPRPERLAYGCPVWSPEGAPGGPYVAAILNTFHQWYLSILPGYDPSQKNSASFRRIVRLGVPLQGLGPIWSPDGYSLYLVQRPIGDGTPQLLKVMLPKDPLSPISSTVIKTHEDWTRVLSLTMDPTGSAFIVLERAVDGSGTEGQVVLRRISFSDPSGGNLLGSPLGLRDQSPQEKILSGQVTLLFNSRSTIGLLLNGDPVGGSPASFFRYDLSYGIPKVLANVEDPVMDLAWSPDGRWVVYSTESGLWGLDMANALQGRASPVWLSPVPVQGLDWH